MQWFGWFRAGEAQAFGRELAGFLVQELRGNLDALNPKGRKKAEKTMVKADRKVQDFRARHRLNVFQKSKLANTFLWTLKEAGWSEQYANQMTDWLTMRL
ncbi:MAG TPA: hypothetical protein VNB23_13415 [Ramlibacter sp.]|nr:hypothetical protein [Ramlibacter sp.]